MRIYYDNLLDKAEALAFAGITAVFFGVAGLGINQFYKSAKWEKLNMVEKLADKDQDGETTTKEWEKVYDKVGVSPHPKSPEDLLLSQLDRYLLSH
jgi:hypothetical protein